MLKQVSTDQEYIIIINTCTKQQGPKIHELNIDRLNGEIDSFIVGDIKTPISILDRTF